MSTRARKLRLAQQSLFSHLAGGRIGPAAVIIFTLDVLIGTHFIIIRLILAQTARIAESRSRSHRKLFVSGRLLRRFIKLILDPADLFRRRPRHPDGALAAALAEFRSGLDRKRFDCNDILLRSELLAQCLSSDT